MDIDILNHGNSPAFQKNKIMEIHLMAAAEAAAEVPEKDPTPTACNNGKDSKIRGSRNAFKMPRRNRSSLKKKDYMVN